MRGVVTGYRAQGRQENEKQRKKNSQEKERDEKTTRARGRSSRVSKDGVVHWPALTPPSTLQVPNTSREEEYIVRNGGNYLARWEAAYYRNRPDPPPLHAKATGIRDWTCCTSPESIYLRSTVSRALSLRSERQRADVSVISNPFGAERPCWLTQLVVRERHARSCVTEALEFRPSQHGKIGDHRGPDGLTMISLSFWGEGRRGLISWFQTWYYSFTVTSHILSPSG